MLDFPGGAMVNNPPANAEDISSIPDLGRIHVVEQLSPCVLTIEPVHRDYRSPRALEPALHKESHHNEKPVHRK